MNYRRTCQNKTVLPRTMMMNIDHLEAGLLGAEMKVNISINQSHIQNLYRSSKLGDIIVVEGKL